MVSDAFEQISATLDTPMAIITVRRGDEMEGCLVGFGTKCSIDPPRYLVCLSKANRTYQVARKAPTIVVHMLHDAEHDRILASLFGEETGFETDKFPQCEWEPGPDDVPVLAGCDWFGGPVVARVDLGDHVGFVLDVEFGSAPRAAERYLGSASVKHLEAGNAP
jgi:flavin reductase (DIM6/NTAB) family NADH-FMN oxidoreductase RutF